MTLDELRERVNGTEEALWWAHRFLQAIVGSHGKASEADQDLAADCLIRIAIADPWWVTQLPKGGPEGHGVATLLSSDRLQRVMERLRFSDVKTEAISRARLLVLSAYWRRSDDDRAARWQQAWNELQRVPEAERDGAWKHLALWPAAVADYPAFRQLASERLTSIERDFWRASFLGEAIPVAARHRDWPTFDAWLDVWNSLPGSLTRDKLEIINLVGLRALDEDRPDDATEAMRKLLAQAPSQQFLSNEEMAALPARLRAEGRCLDLCDQFDELIRLQDWRTLDDGD